MRTPAFKSDLENKTGIKSEIKNTIECLVCKESTPLSPRAVLALPWKAYKCLHCEVAYIYPMPSQEEVFNYYQDYQTTLMSENSLGPLVELHKPIARFLESFFPRGKKITFLDYGFGTGAFLRRVAKDGHHAIGWDYSKQNCDQLTSVSEKERSSVQVQQIQATTNINSNSQSVDCLTLFQVIEHSRDPVALLTELKTLLRDGGILYMECPNEAALFYRFKSWFRGIFNRPNNWGSLNPPQHLFGFGRKSLRRLVTEVGFEVIQMGDYYFRDGVHQVESFEFYPSWGDWSRKSDRFNLYHIAKSSLGTLDFMFSKLFRAGGGLYVVCRLPTSKLRK